MRTFLAFLLAFVSTLAQAQFLAPLTQPQALYVNQLQSTIVPQRAGNTAGYTPTFARATGRSCMDFEPKITYPISGEACMWGARRVRNLVTTPNLSNAAWAKENGGTGTTPTLTYSQTDPAGGSTATRVQANRGAGNTSADYSGVYFRAIASGSTTSVTGRIAVKSNTGSSQTFTLKLDNTSQLQMTATTAWQSFSVSRTQSGNQDFEILSWGQNASSTNSLDLLVAYPQAENVTGQSNQAPSEYVSCGVLSAPYHGAGVDCVKYFTTQNANVVSSTGVVTDATGSPISSIYAKYATLPGASAAYYSTPDSAANSITGDIDIRFVGTLANWATTNQMLVAKWGSGGTTSYRLYLGSANTPTFAWDAGGGTITKAATSTISVANGTKYGIRVTHDVDDGSGNNVVTFYTSNDGGTTWTQLGSPVTTAGTTSHRDTASAVEVGSDSGGTANYFPGKATKVEIYNGIAGTLAVNFDANDYRSGTTWTANTTGETWTVNGTATVFTGSGYFDNAGPYGYLAEGARTNLVLQSQDLGTTWTVQANVTLAANSAVAPDGTTTADKLTAASTTNVNVVTYQALTLSTTTAYTLSDYVKSGTQGTEVVMFLRDDTSGNTGGGKFNPVTCAYVDSGGTTGLTTANQTATLLPNGWCRIQVTVTTGANTGLSYSLRLGTLSGQTSGDNHYFWGQMIEAGTFASTYIPTTTASVTRNGDLLTTPFPGSADATIGSAYLEAMTASTTGNGSSAIPLAFSSNGSLAYTNSSDARTVANAYDGTNSVTKTGLSNITTGIRKRAVSWGVGGMALTGDGAAVATSSFDGSLGTTSITIGSATGGASNWFGPVRKIQVTPAANDASWLRQATSAR